MRYSVKINVSGAHLGLQNCENVEVLEVFRFGNFRGCVFARLRGPCRATPQFIIDDLSTIGSIRQAFHAGSWGPPQIIGNHGAFYVSSGSCLSSAVAWRGKATGEMPL